MSKHLRRKNQSMIERVTPHEQAFFFSMIPINSAVDNISMTWYRPLSKWSFQQEMMPPHQCCCLKLSQFGKKNDLDCISCWTTQILPYFYTSDLNTGTRPCPCVNFCFANLGDWLQAPIGVLVALDWPNWKKWWTNSRSTGEFDTLVVWKI